MAIANPGFCFHETISVLILKYVCGHWSFGRPSLSFLAEATRFLAKMVLGGINYAIDLNKSPWTLAAKQPQSISDFNSRYEVLFLVCIPLLTPNMPAVYMAKKFHFGVI